MKRKYGMSESEYQQLVIDQNYVCAICKRGEPRKNSRLAVDHCHVTGIVRGLLCTKCNTALGLLDEDAEVMKNLVAYLEKHALLNNNLR